jgi:hypothetical protein
LETDQLRKTARGFAPLAVLSDIRPFAVVAAQIYREKIR